MATDGPALRQEDVLGRLVQETRGTEKEWWRGNGANVVDPPHEKVLVLEGHAVSISTYQSAIVPGICQTEDYARGLIGEASGLHPAMVEGRAFLRSQRKRVLSGSGAPRFTAVLDQAVLNRRVGSPGVMREQLQLLVEMASTPGVTIRVLPFDGDARLGTGSGFHVYGLPGSVPPIVEIESLFHDDFVADPGETATYTAAFARFLANALDVHTSVALLQSTLASY